MPIRYEEINAEHTSVEVAWAGEEVNGDQLATPALLLSGDDVIVIKGSREQMLTLLDDARVAVETLPAPGKDDTTNRWVRDETDGGVVTGGQVGGNTQVSESYSVRFTQQEQPPGLVQYALVTYTFYGASDDVNDAGPPFHMERQTELMVCADLKDPGGTEIWSDISYAKLDYGSYNNVVKVELAAKIIANGTMFCEEDWSGMAPWDEETDGEPSEPDQEDGIIQFLRDRYSVSLSASHLGDYETDHEARYWLALEMEVTGFWPNAWTISDHGNAHPITLDKAVPLKDDNDQPHDATKLRELLPNGTNVTVTYESNDGFQRTHETVSGFVDWEYAALSHAADELDPDRTLAVIADNGRGGPRYLIDFDLLLAVTIDPTSEPDVETTTEPASREDSGNPVGA